VIVLDASVAIELLLARPAGVRVRARVLDPLETLCAPHLLDLEVAQVLRRYQAAGAFSSARAAEALEDYGGLPLERYPHHILLDRIWELRHNLTAYDAAYVALAELLGATLLTGDSGLAGVAARSVAVELAQLA
jgi:predicted nucleic acid-binding protein